MPKKAKPNLNSGSTRAAKKMAIRKRELKDVKSGAYRWLDIVFIAVKLWPMLESLWDQMIN